MQIFDSKQRNVNSHSNHPIINANRNIQRPAAKLSTRQNSGSQRNNRLITSAGSSLGIGTKYRGLSEAGSARGEPVGQLSLILIDEGNLRNIGRRRRRRRRSRKKAKEKKEVGQPPLPSPPLPSPPLVWRECGVGVSFRDDYR